MVIAREDYRLQCQSAYTTIDGSKSVIEKQQLQRNQLYSYPEAIFW